MCYVCACLPCDSPNWKIKDCVFVNVPTSNSFLAPRSLTVAYHDRIPDQNSYLSVYPLFLFSIFSFSVFLSPLFPMDPLLRPEYLLLLLEKGEKSLEGHTRLFLVLASLTTYPDNALCEFYDASLNIAYRAPSSEDGPRANFAAFVEGPLWTHCPAHHLPAVRSACPSPPLMESRSPP